MSGARNHTILVIEDDTAVREGLVMNLQLRGFTVVSARDGNEGMEAAFKVRPDLIVLDVMLPGWSGLDILAELREQNNDVPVLLLSARDRVEHKIEGLQNGADDYVTKPFDLPELLARIDALLRRSRRNGEEDVVRFGDVVVNPVSRTVTVDGADVALSAKEFDLLLLLVRSPGRPLTRDAILSHVWGWDFDGTERTVDNFILSLRQKVEKNPARPRYIKTVRQVGYKFEP